MGIGEFFKRIALRWTTCDELEKIYAEEEELLVEFLDCAYAPDAHTPNPHGEGGAESGEEKRIRVIFAGEDNIRAYDARYLRGAARQVPDPRDILQRIRQLHRLVRVIEELRALADRQSRKIADKRERAALRKLMRLSIRKSGRKLSQALPHNGAFAVDERLCCETFERLLHAEEELFAALQREMEETDALINNARKALEDNLRRQERELARAEHEGGHAMALERHVAQLRAMDKGFFRKCERKVEYLRDRLARVR